MIHDLYTELVGNAYPGRGIVLGRSADNKHAVIAYFIMGRSANSRNRVFEETEDGIRTRAFDESKLEDPSLIIYHPVRVWKGSTVVTNGDQTDTIRDAFVLGGSFETALATREFEPDPPNYTPRISGVVRPDGSYALSILKSAEGNPASCQRFYYHYDAPIAGQGHFIHTYERDGDPLPSFAGDPTLVGIGNDIDAFTDLVWKGLNDDNKISLFVRYIDLADGSTETRILNKNQ